MEISVRSDHLLRECIGIEEESSDLHIDEILCLIRDYLATSLSSEIVPFGHIGCEILGSDLRIESESHDHRSCDLGSSLDIRGGARRDIFRTEEYLLSHPSTIESCEFIEVLRLRCIRTILLWEEPCHSTCSASRKDRDLVDRISMGEHLPNEGMSDLMDSCEFFLMFGHSQRFFLIAHDDFLY